MKILIINGSPRKQGHISKMLQLMETEARANGDEVTVIRKVTAQRYGGPASPSLHRLYELP